MDAYFVNKVDRDQKLSHRQVKNQREKQTKKLFVSSGRRTF